MTKDELIKRVNEKFTGIDCFELGDNIQFVYERDNGDLFPFIELKKEETNSKMAFITLGHDLIFRICVLRKLFNMINEYIETPVDSRGL